MEGEQPSRGVHDVLDRREPGARRGPEEERVAGRPGAADQRPERLQRLLGQRGHHIIGEAAEGIAHHGVMLIEQVRAEVTIALQHLLADGGNIVGGKLGRHE